MANHLLLAAAVMISCVIFHKISGRIGVPMLLAFMLLGMFFGTDGVMKVPFDNYAFAEEICSTALIIIMFTGGFGTKWSEARPVACKALVLSALGTLLTAGLVGLFCMLALRIAALESFLIGAVISSTDAASVFSILRSKRLNLRENTASLLEIESGSNDPFSYMLTVVLLSLMGGAASAGSFAGLLLRQLGFGVLFGFGVAGLTLLFLKKFRISSEGFSAIFILAIALISYAAPTRFGGNGYLSAYIAGIVLGNRPLENKRPLVHFFDAATGLMQMLLFFLLGLLAFPSRLPGVAPTAVWIALFLTLVARPVAVFLILSPFGSSLSQKLLVSWAGMRGAASIVFAIMAVLNSSGMDRDLFHIVFFIVLFSILLQGTLIPVMARRLGMTDARADVMKTFNDYVDEAPVQFIRFTLPPAHAWVGQPVHALRLPPDSLLILLKRGAEQIVPNGSTVLAAGDTLILSGAAADAADGLRLYERTLEKGDGWIGKRIAELPSEELIVLIRRGDGILIPKGDTRLQQKDSLIITHERSGVWAD